MLKCMRMLRPRLIAAFAASAPIKNLKIIAPLNLSALVIFLSALDWCPIFSGSPDRQSFSRFRSIFSLSEYQVGPSNLSTNSRQSVPIDGEPAGPQSDRDARL